jgi:hypothetical protein
MAIAGGWGSSLLTSACSEVSHPGDSADAGADDKEISWPSTASGPTLAWFDPFPLPSSCLNSSPLPGHLPVGSAGIEPATQGL